MAYFVFFIKQLFRLIQWFFFLSFLIGQGQSKIVHADIISEPDKVEITFIFDEIIDRDDVSGWIDRNNYFTLSLFNVSMGSRDIFSKKYPGGHIKFKSLNDEKISILFIDCAGSH